MPDFRIICIKRSHPNGGHEHITHIGGQGWTRTREQGVQLIETKTDTFYVVSPAGKRADVGVVTPASGPKFLRTYADGIWTDNLLSLPECR